MNCQAEDAVRLRRDPRGTVLRGSIGTKVGRAGEGWADQDGERISVVYEDERVLAGDLPPAGSVVEPCAGAARF